MSEKTVEKKNTGWQEFYELLESFAMAIVLVVLIFTLLFRIFVVKGPSMKSTLIDGDRIVATNLFFTPKTGDVIIFSGKYNNGEVLVKRVIGVPGDMVDISEDGKVYLNGKVLDEPYLDDHQVTLKHPYSPMKLPYTVQEEELFVLGDNRLESLDSRSADIGVADTKRVLGKVVFRLFPNTGVIEDGE